VSLPLSSQIDKRYVRSGEITHQVRKEVEGRDWRNKSYVEICEFVEDAIRRRGGEPAFPTNVCVNESTAHYTAEIEDSKIVVEDALLKVDLGSHIDGFITDTSVPLCYNEDLMDMTESTKSALTEAIKAIRAGVHAGDVGKIVEAYAARRGYRPIANLAGHSLEQYVIHAGLSIPNVSASHTPSFKEGKVYAVEPFFTTGDGSGIVVEGKSKNIFGLVARKNTKNQRLNDLLDLIWKNRRTLPFAARWFAKDYRKEELQAMLRELERMKLIRSYPELIEGKKKPVAQAEHTVATTAAGTLVLT
jgi:methionyl aminopeptidase